VLTIRGNPECSVKSGILNGKNLPQARNQRSSGERERLAPNAAGTASLTGFHEN